MVSDRNPIPVLFGRRSSFDRHPNPLTATQGRDLSSAQPSGHLRGQLQRVTLVSLLCLLTWQLPAAAHAIDSSRPGDHSTELSSLLREIVIAQLPHEYENTRQWGGTKEVWDGLHVSLDGLRIKTKRRKKQANHGTWKRYRAWLIEPGKNLRIRVANEAPTEDGRAAFDLIVTAKLGAFGRLSEWNRDVQLVSVSVTAEADITMSMRCELGLAFDFKHLPPDVRLEPTVRAANLRLDRFRLHRVSDLHGPLVRQLGRSLHDVLQREVDRRADRLPGKLNRQVAKHQEDWVFSLHDLWQSEYHELFDAFSGVPTEDPETLLGHRDRRNP